MRCVTNGEWQRMGDRRQPHKGIVLADYGDGRVRVRWDTSNTPITIAKKFIDIVAYEQK